MDEAKRIDREAQARVYRAGTLRHYAFANHQGIPGSGFESVVHEIVSECEQRTIYPKITAAWRCRLGSEAGHKAPPPAVPRPVHGHGLGRGSAV